MAIAFFIHTWFKLFVLLTPFFALSVFLGMTRDFVPARRRRLALRTAAAGGAIAMAVFFFGREVFALFGITLDAFRVGAGTLLLVSSVASMRGQPTGTEPGADEEVAVVPLAMPIIVGPATIGALMVMGAEISTLGAKLAASLAVLLAVAGVGSVLLLGETIERRMGVRGVRVLGKVTGVFVAAMAAEMILTGLGHRLGAAP
jgi:multiple antibiotic resistance protein